MSFFKNKVKVNTEAKQQEDFVGYQPLPSDAYQLKFTSAYFRKASESKAIAVVLEADIVGSDKKFKETLWVANKEGESTYTKKDKPNEPIELPAFAQFRELFKLAAGIDITQDDIEEDERIVEMYVAEAGCKQNVKVIALPQLIGEEVGALVQHVIDNKQVKQGNKYVPSNEKRESNELVKFYNLQNNMTVNELTAYAESNEEPTDKFVDIWLKANKGKVRDKSKNVAGSTGSIPTMPTSSASATTVTESDESLFGDD